MTKIWMAAKTVKTAGLSEDCDCYIFVFNHLYLTHLVSSDNLIYNAI